MSKNNNGGPCVQRNQEYTYDPVRSLNRMVSEPYYLFHLLVFFSYIPIRFSASQLLSPARNSFLLKRVFALSLLDSHFIYISFYVCAAILIQYNRWWERFSYVIYLFETFSHWLTYRVCATSHRLHKYWVTCAPSFRHIWRNHDFARIWTWDVYGFLPLH